jgi:hypothetical protein
VYSKLNKFKNVTPTYGSPGPVMLIALRMAYPSPVRDKGMADSIRTAVTPVYALISRPGRASASLFRDATIFWAMRTVTKILKATVRQKKVG